MSNLLNLLNCLIVGQENTRIPQCVLNPALQDYLFLVPRGYKFTFAATADSASIQTAIVALAQNDSPTARGFKIGQLVTTESTSEAATEETAGNGQKREVRGATIAWRYTIWNGGLEYHTALYSFNNHPELFDLLIIDKAGVIYGTWSTDVSGNRVLKGFDLTRFSVGNYNFPTATTGGNFTIEVGLTDATQMNSRISYLQTDFDIVAAMDGLYNVFLTATSSSATAVNVQAKIGGTDLHNTATYPAALAQVGVYRVVNRDPNNANYGNLITVASVANSGTGTGLTLAATGTDPDNPGSGKKVGISYFAPSVLAALSTPLLYLESNETVVTLG